MNEYRKEVSNVGKETSWTFLRFSPVILLIVGVLFGLKYFGLIGSTIVEREVFKHSFQYKEGMNQRAATLEASIIELEILIQNEHDGNVRKNLTNQKTILKAQLRAITLTK